MVGLWMLLANRHSYTSAISYHKQLRAFIRGSPLLLCLFLAILGWDQGKLHREVVWEKASIIPRTQPVALCALSDGLLHHHEARSTPGRKGIRWPQSTQKRVSSRLLWELNLANQKHNYHWREKGRKDFSHSWTKPCSWLNQKLLRDISSQESPQLVQKYLGKTLYVDFLSQT